jgi:hypothetical protein
VIVSPPSLDGAVKAADSCELDSVIVVIVGALGTSAGSTLADVASDASLFPTEFFARSLTVYVVPFVSPPI